MMNVLQASDVMPTMQSQKGVKDLLESVEGLKARWDKLK